MWGVKCRAPAICQFRKAEYSCQLRSAGFPPFFLRVLKGYSDVLRTEGICVLKVKHLRLKLPR